MPESIPHASAGLNPTRHASSKRRKRLGKHTPRRDAYDRTAHADGEAFSELDGELSAGHVHRHGGVAKSEPPEPGRAAAAPRGERVAGPSLPDLELEVRAVEHLDELHVGPVREAEITLDDRSERPRLLRARALAQDHAVRVAERRRGERQHHAAGV